MRITQHGTTVELDENDARIPVIQMLLYGRPIPPPLPAPSFANPASNLPDNAVRFWRALSPVQRKELALLADHPYTPAEMESALGLTQRQLMGRHGSLAQLASVHGVAVRIRARGRSRALRRFYVDDACAALIRSLAAVTDSAKAD